MTAGHPNPLIQRSYGDILRELDSTVAMKHGLNIGVNISNIK